MTKKVLISLDELEELAAPRCKAMDILNLREWFDAQPDAPQWVGVEDENESPYYYPHSRFWVRLRDSTVTLDVSFDDNRGFIGPFRDYSLDSGEITHWMPIPSLPGDENDN
jgi:hypothetical protein